MSNPVSVRFRDREWKRAIQRLGRKAPKAFRRALRRAGTTGKAAGARAIRDDMGLKVSRIKSEIKVEVKESSVQFSVTGSRIPLIEFGARGPEPTRGKGRGVSYKIGKQRGRIGNAFIATMRSGHRGVFKRLGTSRLPIAELSGPSIVRVFSRVMPSDAVVEPTKRTLMDRLRHEFAQAAKR